MNLRFAMVRQAGWALLLVATGAGAQTSAQAQTPPPPGAQTLVEGAPRRGPYMKPLTPAQQIAAGLPSAGPGGLFPIPALVPGSPMPSSDPRDFSGSWYHDQNLISRNVRDVFEQPLPYTMAGVKVLERRVNAIRDGKPYINASAICRPPGPQWQLDLTFPFQIFQGAEGLEFVFQEYHGRWNVAFDPAKLPAGKHYMGRSAARWDGDTLVVETSDFKDGMWFDTNGTPVSANAKLSQRIRKVDWGDRQPYLEILTTVIDPEYYTRPWTVTRLFSWSPHQALFKEYNCEEQMGDPTVPVDAGLLPEPKD